MPSRPTSHVPRRTSRFHPWVRLGYPEYARSPALYDTLQELSTLAVKIRLRRVGGKKAPMYRIVVADSKSPRDGKFIEIVGQYQPRTGDQAINLDTDRVNHWLNVGAQPTDTVRSLLRKAGVLKQRHEARLATKLQAAAVPVAEGKADEA